MNYADFINLVSGGGDDDADLLEITTVTQDKAEELLNLELQDDKAFVNEFSKYVGSDENDNVDSTNREDNIGANEDEPDCINLDEKPFETKHNSEDNEELDEDPQEPLTKIGNDETLNDMLDSSINDEELDENPEDEIIEEQLDEDPDENVVGKYEDESLENTNYIEPPEIPEEKRPPKAKKTLKYQNSENPENPEVEDAIFKNINTLLGSKIAKVLNDE